MSDMVAVRLVKPVGRNNAGEVCGFPADHAKRLVKGGFAVLAQEAEAPVEARANKMEHGEQRRPRRAAKAEGDGN